MATMKDVAQQAGVDKGTVSRVLRGDPRISDGTALRVWEAARALGYRPDPAARGLAGGRTGLAGVLLPSLGDWWTGFFLEGAFRVLEGAGMDLLPLESRRDPEGARKARDRFASRKVEGVLWMDPQIPESPWPMPLVRWGDDPGATLGFHRERVLEAVRGAFPRARFRYRGGPGALFPFLRLLEGTPGDRVLEIHDAAGEDPPDEALWCGDPREARLRGLPCLPWGAFEVGVAAARTLLRRLRRSEEVLPPLRWVLCPRTPQGDPWSSGIEVHEKKKSEPPLTDPRREG